MSKETVGLLAGTGQLPYMALRTMKRQGFCVFVLGIEGVTPKELLQEADGFELCSIVELGKAQAALKKHGIKKLLFLGKVAHASIFDLKLWKMDWTAIRTWLSMKDRRTDTLLGAICDSFLQEGIEVVDSSLYLREYLAVEGRMTKINPSPKAFEDLSFGLSLSRTLADANIGQSLIVKNRAVVAVEAMEGTDACIDRAATLCKGAFCLIKVARAKQDMRFDLPTIGCETIRKLARHNAAALFVEASCTLLACEGSLNPIALADSLGIPVYGVKFQS